MKARFEQAVGMAFGERDRLRHEIEDLSAERSRLTAEVERLKEENDALRGSAEIWIRMYEGQLSRAKRMEEELSAISSQLSDLV